MGLLTKFSLAIRRRETPFYDRLYRIAKAIHSFNIPYSKGFHNFLYKEWAARTVSWHAFWRVFYYEPMFKSQCRKVGKGFRLEYAGNGICRILGNLQIFIGDNVTIFDNLSLAATRVYDEPELHIGSDTYVGPQCSFNVAKKIHIGSNTVLGSATFFTDNPGHPNNPFDRLVSGGGLPEKERIKPVHIGDYCFFGRKCMVYPGTHVSDGVVVRSKATLSGYFPPFASVGGTPCKVSKLMYIPEKMRDIVGEEKYKSWIEEQDAYMEKYPDTQRAYYDN